MNEKSISVQTRTKSIYSIKGSTISKIFNKWADGTRHSISVSITLTSTCSELTDDKSTNTVANQRIPIQEGVLLSQIIKQKPS